MPNVERVVAVLLLACAAVAPGCSPSIDSPSPYEGEDSLDQETRPKKKRKDSELPVSEPGRETRPTEGEPQAPPESTRPGTPPASATTWVGKLATTGSVQFGGGGYCTYSARFTDLEVTMTRDASGNILSSVVKATFEEIAVSQCAQPVIPVHVHSYDYVAGAAGATTAITFSAATPNEPRAKLVATPSTGGQPSVKLEWRRVDIGPPLDWSLTADVVLTPSST